MLFMFDDTENGCGNKYDGEDSTVIWLVASFFGLQYLINEIITPNVSVSPFMLYSFNFKV